MLHHVPVLTEQVLDGLKIKPDGTYWDGTFGRGGHSRLILEQLGETGRLFGSDRDEASVGAAESFSGPRFCFLRGALSKVITEVPSGLSGFLWDVGCSTPQLKNPSRGFSFKEEGPLDMRMDQSQELSAADIVNETEETELANLIYKYGEERFSRRLAARIVEKRQQAPLTTTTVLAQICKDVYPKRYHRIDPATRTFQALRIVVNGELDELENTLPLALAKLAPGGRAVVISFHSLEDRIVKHCFRDHARSGSYKVITKRPLIANEQEAAENPASRSAKLRVLERT